ncbi:MAG: pyridoxamine 5'-phosphate oxidase family protein [Candidatus Hodarchaeales archaeon]|jgi:nitroimidazol reductase NimA-like FMN-containing flavoprotein (pyridoxamine 5'-phosphate oxidase superfamily)
MSEFDKFRDRPYIPGYGIEKSDKGLLSWDFIRSELKDAKNYWLSTTRPNGKPHAIPIWGSWINDKFYFGGGSETQNRKNLAKNPYIVVHSESGTKTVILEGMVDLEEDNEEIIKLIKEDYKKKYDLDHPEPFYVVNIKKAFAWDMKDYAGTPTRWKFN